MKKVLMVSSAIFLLTLSAVGARAEDTRTAETGGIATMIPPVVESQFFCGYCHILTYPKVIKKAHASWRNGKHKDVPCADCHYAPEARDRAIPGHRRIPQDERAAEGQKRELEFMKTELEVLSRLITILNMEESTVQRRSRVDDRNCTTAECHPTTGEGKKGEYWVKKLEYTEYEREDKSKGLVHFSHDKHYDREKWVKGDEMHCTVCHQQLTEDKHFEVSGEICTACHFGNKKFNEGLSKCSLCHKIPEKPLQKQKKKEEEEKKEKEEPITHKKLEEAKVPCWSCHYEVLKGDGTVTKETCFECHDNGKAILKDMDKVEVMHREHVAAQTARCQSCHEPIEHKRPDDFLKVAMEDCSGCHENTHRYQRMLLTGEVSDEVAKTPALMTDVKTNCLGCHLELKPDKVKGHKVKKATAKSCVDCHTKRHEDMLKEWKDKIKEELEAVEEVEKEAEDALENAKGKVPEQKLQEALEMFEKAEEVLNVVRYGNGVHNKKYSIMLIDVAFDYFEDILDHLQG